MATRIFAVGRGKKGLGKGQGELVTTKQRLIFQAVGEGQGELGEAPRLRPRISRIIGGDSQARNIDEFKAGFYPTTTTTFTGTTTTGPPTTSTLAPTTSTAPPVVTTSTAPPVVTTSTAPPVVTTSTSTSTTQAPTTTTLAPPVTTSTAPPVTTSTSTSTAPPVTTTTITAPPVTTTSTAPPVVTTTTITAPPVTTTSTSTTQAPTTTTLGPTTTSTAPAMLDLDFGCTDLYGSNLVAQSLTPDVTWDIGAIRIGVLYTNAADGDVRLTLWTHHPTNPYSGQLLGTSQEVAVDQAPAEAYVFNFSSPVQVGQKFWVVIEPRGTATGVWTNREATNQYPGGHIAWSGTPTGTSWTLDTNYDICDLQVYGTSPGPSTTTSTSTTAAPTTSTLAPTTSTEGPTTSTLAPTTTTLAPSTSTSTAPPETTTSTSTAPPVTTTSTAPPETTTSTEVPETTTSTETPETTTSTEPPVVTTSTAPPVTTTSTSTTQAPTTTTLVPTTSTTVMLGNWVQQFGLTRWVCLSNCTWTGSVYRESGPGLNIRPTTGSWYVNYRPTHVRVTFTHTFSVSWDLRDNAGNTISSGTVPSGTSVVRVFPITWQGNDLGPSVTPSFLGRISNAGGDCENIEFFEPLVSTTTTQAPTTSTSSTVGPTTSTLPETTTSTSTAPPVTTTSTAPPVVTTSTEPPVVTTSTSTTQAPTTTTLVPTTSTTVAEAGEWVSHIGGPSSFGCGTPFGTTKWTTSGGNTRFVDSSPDYFDACGPGGFGLDATGSWMNGLRPTKIRVTITNGTLSWTLQDGSGNIASGASQQGSPAAEVAISGQVSDIVSFTPANDFTGWRIEDIEFFIPTVTTTTTQAPTTSTSSTLVPTTSTEGPTTSTEAPTTSTEAPTTTQAPTTSTLAPTTTTTVAEELFILPDGDVSMSIGTFGSGTGGWGKMNSGINSGTPDDTNGIVGLDGDSWRGTFESPSFAGTSTQIKVHVRARSDNPPGTGFTVQLFSDGSNSDGSDIWSTTGSYANYTTTFSVAKTAAQLTNLEVFIRMEDSSDDDRVSEVEVEIVLA